MARWAVVLVSLILTGTAACESSLPYDPGGAGALTALRPPCGDPAPVIGAPDVRAPGFIVVFHPTVDAELETARLAEAYGFQPRHVFTAALEGFSADLSREVVASLRCVSTVDFIEHVQVLTVD